MKSTILCILVLFPTICYNIVEVPKNITKIAMSKLDTSYLDDKTWARKYPKIGDRTARITGYDTTVPIYKRTWTSWKGKRFADKTKLEEIATSVVKRMPFIEPSNEVISLIVETAITESQGGYYVKSLGGDYGIMQIRINTANDLLKWLKINHNDIYKAVEMFRDTNKSLQHNLETNIPYGMAICIAEYWRKAGADFTSYITTVHDRAVMWKSVYNTKKGKGTINAYIQRNRQYVQLTEKTQL